MGILFKKIFDVFIVFEICVVFFSLSANALPTTNERGIQQGRAFYWGQTADDLSRLVTENNARLTRLRVQDPNIPTFSATMVQNSGSFGSAWWWYYGIDAQTLSGLLDGKRLISIDPYFTNEGLRFAVVMVPDTGTQDRAWWWYWGQSAADVGRLVQENNARPIDLRPYNDGGQLHFAVVMIENTGADKKNWEWWFGETPSFISSRIQTGLRVMCLAPDPFGNWVTVLVENDGDGWYWWYGISPSQALQNFESHGTRLIDISPYFVGSTLEFATVELDDSLGPQDGLEI